MGQAPLVNDQIVSGKQFIEHLIAEGVGVTVAGWLFQEEHDRWYLYIATPLVPETGGTRNAYGRINEILRKMPPPFWFDPLAYRVISPKSATALDMQTLQATRPAGVPVWVTQTKRLGNVIVEGAYIYPTVFAAVA